MGLGSWTALPSFDQSINIKSVVRATALYALDDVPSG
jgi:hypothetical protein